MAQNLLQKVGDCCLTVGAGNANHLHIQGRITIKLGRGLRHYPARIINHDGCYLPGTLNKFFAEHDTGTCGNRLGYKIVAVTDRATQGEKGIPRLDPSRIILQTCYGKVHVSMNLSCRTVFQNFRKLHNHRRQTGQDGGDMRTQT